MQLPRHIKQGLKLLLRWGTARDITVLPDDIYLVAYPKAGSTWLRFLMGNLYFNTPPVTFANLERYVSDVYHHERALLRIKRPRILRSHEYFDPRYKTVIYLARDPRDILLSYYFHYLKFRLMKDGTPLEAFAPIFLRGETNQFGSWGEHVGGWLGARGDTPGFLLLRYEDLQKDAPGVLRRIATFLKLERSDADLQRAVAQCTAAQMREMEQEQGRDWELTRHSRTDIPFVRSATAGQWRQKLPAVLAAQVEAQWPKQMALLGYT